MTIRDNPLEISFRHGRNIESYMAERELLCFLPRVMVVGRGNPEAPFREISRFSVLFNSLPISRFLKRISRFFQNSKINKKSYIIFTFVEKKVPVKVSEMTQNAANGACPPDLPSLASPLCRSRKKPSLFSSISGGRSPYFALFLLRASGKSRSSQVIFPTNNHHK